MQKEEVKMDYNKGDENPLLNHDKKTEDFVDAMFEKKEHKTKDDWDFPNYQKSKETQAPETKEQEKGEKLFDEIKHTSPNGDKNIKENTFNKLMEKTENRGLKFPQSHIKIMEKKYNEDLVSINCLSYFIEKVYDKYKAQGFDWKDVKDPEPGKEVSSYVNELSGTKAYIQTFQNPEAPEETLYKAVLIDNNEQQKILNVNNNVEGLKDYVKLVHTQGVIKEVSKELQQELFKNEPKQQKETGHEMSI